MRGELGDKGARGFKGDMGERGIKVKIIMFKGEDNCYQIFKKWYSFINVSLPNTKAIKI